MSGKTFVSSSDENASVPTEQLSWQSEAESRGHYDWQDFSIWPEDEGMKHPCDVYTCSEAAKCCRNALYENEGTAHWLRNTLLAVEHLQPCMQSPAKQLVAHFLLGEPPTQLEDLCELALEGKPSWWRKLLSNFVIGAK